MNKVMQTLLVPILCIVFGHLFGVVKGCLFDEKMDKYVADRMQSFPGETLAEKCSVLAGGNNSSQHISYPTVKLFLFHHEEPEILADWLQYHGHIFGLSNLHVIDHKSTDPRICSMLALYKACGTVVVDFDLPFPHKKKALSALMGKYNASFLVPLDTDEFIIKIDHKKSIVADKAAILDIFKNLVIDGKKYKFNSAFFVKYDKKTCNASLAFRDRRDPSFRRVINPGFFSWGSDFLHPMHRKTFYHSEGFINTDQGNHFGQVENDGHNITWMDPLVIERITDYYHFPNLALLHMFFPSYYGQKFKYIRGADAYGHSEKTNCAKVGLGKDYCFAARNFRKDDNKALTKYLEGCSASATDNLSTRVFQKWFEDHSLTMQEMVGQEIVAQTEVPFEAPVKAEPIETKKGAKRKGFIKQIFSLFG